MKLIKLRKEDLIASNIESITNPRCGEFGSYSFSVIMKSGKQNCASYLGFDKETAANEIKEIHSKLLEYFQNTDTSIFNLDNLLNPPVPKPFTKPRLGAMVMYVSPKCETKNNNIVDMSPSIVVRCHENNRGVVNLKVLLDDEKDLWVKDVTYSETNEPGTWHYPPRL